MQPILTRRRAVLAGSGAALGLAAPAIVRAQGSLKKMSILISTAPADPAFHVYYYAQENGFYREQGLDFEMVPTNGDATAVRVLLSGGADIASVGALPTIQAVLAGTQLDIVSCFSPKLDYLMVTSAGVHDAKALSGQVVAVSQVGATSHLISQLLIRQGGGDPSQVNWLSVGASSARVQALVAKRVAGAPLNAIYAARAASFTQTNVIGDAARDLPELVYGWEIVTPRTLARDRAAIQGYVTATAKAARWAIDHPDEAAAISVKVLPDQPAADIATAIRAYAAKQFWGTSGALPRKNWDFTIDAMRDLGAIAGRPSEGIVIREFSDNAAKQLGPFRG